MASVPQELQCSKCGIFKPFSDFWRNRPVCKACGKYEWVIKQGPEYREQRRAYNRDKLRLDRYGITPEQYTYLLASQKGCCAICGCTPSDKRNGAGSKTGQFAVDHNHVTGEIRSLLCHSCNAAIGLFGEDQTLLSIAMAYIEWYA